jgi:hypothetical protein
VSGVGVGSGFSLVASIGGAIAVLWVVGTVVRRHRPDAYRPLLAWAIASLVATLVNFIVYPLLSVVMMRSGGGTASYVAALEVVRLGTSAIHVGVVVLLVRGLVAIAQPPRQVVAESDAPYR